MELATLIKIGSVIVGVTIVLLMKWRLKKVKPDKEKKKEEIKEEEEHIDRSKYKSI